MNTPWPEDQFARAKELYDKGHTGSHIASVLWEEFGVRLTRSAVMGKLSRKKTLRTRQPRKAKPPKAVPPRLAKVQAPVSAKPLPPVKSKGTVRYLQRRRGQCAWPCWEGSPPIEQRMVCGAPTEGQTYCPEHMEQQKRGEAA